MELRDPRILYHSSSTIRSAGAGGVLQWVIKAENGVK